MDTSPVRKLIILDGDFSALLESARNYLQDVEVQRTYDDDLLRLVDIDAALRLYEENVLSGTQLRQWAEVMEMNEYVRYEPGLEHVIADALFRISTPEINEAINDSMVRALRSALVRARKR